MSNLSYHSGFGNEFASEAIAGTLPVGQNSPQKVAHGLYAEQISGTAFTAPRHQNRRSWLYRIRPAAIHGTFEPREHPAFHNHFDETATSPNQLRWDPYPLPTNPTDFVEGLYTMAGNGSAASQSGCGIHVYAANKSMHGRFFYDADGELLIVPQQGRLRLATELGVLEIEPQEIAVIPRGIRFRVELLDAEARGYVAENFGSALRLPDLGPIGSNGLANARDFLAPAAAYEDVDGDFELVAKFQGSLWSASIDHSPLDVVGWHGNHAPYKYDLRRFNTIGSISYDHPDPSIFTVLTSPSDTAGVANLDFVIFPPRWLVAEHTFRPPWFHRNIASEFMGLVHGAYDAKAGGFVPGGASLHNCMSGHGPDAASFEKASIADVTKPDHITDTMAFMLETRAVIHPSRQALDSPHRQRDYQHCWHGLKKHFIAPARRVVVDERAAADPYAGYAAWKEWSGAFAASDREARYFAEELRGIALKGKRVLEVGFGDGSFLAWAKGEGAEVAGIEINAKMRDAAREHGFETFDVSLAELAQRGARYDLVAAFDVLEHWDTDELVANFHAIRAMLVDGGFFVSRFPNGQSPFGRVYQHGDFSHKSVLSTYKIEYLAGLANFGIVRIDNVRRVPSRPGPLASVRHWWLARRRRWIERSIARLYGIRKLPLDPNLVAVLRKPGANESLQRNPA